MIVVMLVVVVVMVVVGWNTEGAYGASEGLPMKQGAPISPSFTISSGVKMLIVMIVIMFDMKTNLMTRLTMMMMVVEY